METPTADFRLRAARFFLEKLKEVQRFSRSEDLGYYLNAFLGAARSVTWGLQNDLGKDYVDARLAAWKTAHPADVGFLDFMNERIESPFDPERSPTVWMPSTTSR